jgi:hypothetical protein
MTIAPAGSVSGEGRSTLDLTDFSRLCADLRRVARGVDEMWRESLTDGCSGPLSIRLGAASHAVHRALIALEGEAVSPVS